MSGQVTRSGQLILLQKSLQPRHGYSSRRVSMKLTGLHDVISTYKKCVSEFLSWWYKVRSISWPLHYKPMGKYENASRFAWTNRNHPILSGSWPLTPPVMIRVQLVIGGYGKVIWDHKRSQSFFANNSRQDRDRDAQMVPCDLACQDASEYMLIDLSQYPVSTVINLTNSYPIVSGIMTTITDTVNITPPVINNPGVM